MTPKHAQTPTVSLGTVFDLLTHPYRRYIFYYFVRQSTETATLEELVDTIHTRLDTPPPREELLMGLRHTHLPKLADHNVIEYDARNETIRYCDGDHVENVVTFAMREEATGKRSRD